MDYPRKPKCFKSAWRIEEERRKAITTAYQTLYKELYEENKKLRKNLTQIQRDLYMSNLSNVELRTDVAHRDYTIETLNNALKETTK